MQIDDEWFVGNVAAVFHLADRQLRQEDVGLMVGIIELGFYAKRVILQYHAQTLQTRAAHLDPGETLFRSATVVYLGIGLQVLWYP